MDFQAGCCCTNTRARTVTTQPNLPNLPPDIAKPGPLHECLHSLNECRHLLFKQDEALGRIDLQLQVRLAEWVKEPQSPSLDAMLDALVIINAGYDLCRRTLARTHVYLVQYARHGHTAACLTDTLLSPD
jgi:hypothetical protein